MSDPSGKTVTLATGDAVRIERIAPGDVFQIRPDFDGNKAFSACMLTVTEVKSWGVQGYVQALGEGREEIGGCAYMRVKWEDIAYVGRAVWMVS